MELVEPIGGRVMKRPLPKWELLTMHTARHTSATQSLLRGISVEVLQKVLGHSRIQITMVIFRKFPRPVGSADTLEHPV